MDMGGKKLYRDTENKMIAGVCAGIAEYFGIDVTLVRLVAVVLILGAGSGILLYIVAAIVIPAKPTAGKTPTDKPKE